MIHSLRVPICAVCGAPVQFFSEERDSQRCVTAYVARCHGAEQIVELDDLQIMSAGPGGILAGLAFVEPNQLTAAPADSRHSDT